MQSFGVKAMVLNLKQMLGSSLSCGVLVFVAQLPAYGGSLAPLRTSTAQSAVKTSPNPLPANKNRKPQKKAPWQAFLEEISQRLRRSPTNAVSRGSICAIAPGIIGQRNHIVSDRPLFLWQGQVDEIEIRHFTTDEVLWAQSIPEGQQYMHYSGQPLHPGSTYIWTLKYQGQARENRLVEIMEQHLRESFLQAGTAPIAIRDRSQTRPIIHPSSLKQADYFLEQELWSDAVSVLGQEMSGNRTEAIEGVIKSWANHVCSGENLSS